MGYDDINRLYRQYLGRDASQDEANNWISGAYGATDPQGIAQQIQSSGEAQDYARRASGSSGSSGAPSGGGGVSGDAIAALYQRYLGRAANPDEIANWQNGTYGATDLGGIEAQIRSSGEAQAYGGGGGGGGGYGGGISPPYLSSGGGGGTGGGGNTWGAGTGSNPFGPWQGRYTAPEASPLPGAPTFTPPGYTAPPAFAYDESHPAPGYTPPPAFSYGDFVAPTAETALNDPGYQFRTQQGRSAIETAAAARGTLGDSGTFKALIDYNSGAASQEYQNVWNRDYQGYTTNRSNALDTYNTNYRTQYQDPYTAALEQWQTGRGNALDTYKVNYQTQYQDPYAASYKAAQDAFAPQLLNWQTQTANTQHENDLANTNAWNDYLLGWQDYEQRRNLGANFALQS